MNHDGNFHEKNEVSQIDQGSFRDDPWRFRTPKNMILNGLELAGTSKNHKKTENAKIGKVNAFISRKLF